MYRSLSLDRRLAHLQERNGQLDRFLVTPRGIVCKLGYRGFKFGNLLALAVLGDGHGFGHRLHKQGGKVLPALGAPFRIARDPLWEPVLGGRAAVADLIGSGLGFLRRHRAAPARPSNACPPLILPSPRASARCSATSSNACPVPASRARSPVAASYRLRMTSQ